MGTLPTEPTSQDNYLALAKAGQTLLRIARLNRLSDEELSARSGVAKETIQRLLDSGSSPESFLEVLKDLKGKDWERLFGAASIYAEDWLSEAKIALTPSNVGQSYGPAYLASCGLRPSEETDQKIKGLLNVTNAFYLTASTEYIKQHGQSTNRPKPGKTYSFQHG